MHKTTLWRARTIVKRGEIIPCEDCVPPDFFHFKVKQRKNHGWTDVWYIKKNGVMEWSCGAVDPNNNHDGEKWGCIMNVGVDRQKVFCSHTLAAQIYMEQKIKEAKEKC